MAYRIRFTNLGDDTYNHCLDYLLYRVGGTGNPQAATHFLEDLERALNTLSLGAESYNYCRDPSLARLKLRQLHFPEMRYKILYSIRGNEVWIEAIMHSLQDYNTIYDILNE